MNLPELLAEWERRRADAECVHASAPIAEVYNVVLEEARQIDGVPTRHLMTTKEAAFVLSVSPRTVARRCKRGGFPGAVKTSGDDGEWRIPSDEVYTANGQKQRTTPRLWKEGNDG